LPTPNDPTDRAIRSAELLSIGSELLVGETRDTNAGDLSGWLASHGVSVERITALRDRLDDVVAGFAAALDRVDLVISTVGLGPTPDDLTREAIAQVVGETPTVDPDLERWLRELWARRRLPFPASNRKQAWLIPSAVALPNPNGTAPGWFVTRPDGRVVVALPGPPREMHPMWEDHALPRLRARAGGLGEDVASRTYRLTGIGESQVAEILGDELLRGGDPEVATYARSEAVDVRVSAIGRVDRPAADAVAAVGSIIEARLGAHIWSTGSTTWAEAIGRRLADRGWSLVILEIATNGHVGALLGDITGLRYARSQADDDLGPSDAERDRALRTRATDLRAGDPTTVGLAVAVREIEGDCDVAVAISTPDTDLLEHRTAFLGGRTGRARAALTTAALLLASLSDTRQA
jgi:nicotinamide-nucleotide amidase